MVKGRNKALWRPLDDLISIIFPRFHFTFQPSLAANWTARRLAMAANVLDAVMLFGDSITQGSWELNGVGARLSCRFPFP